MPFENGDFEYECTCPWLGDSFPIVGLPAVWVPEGHPCSYLRIGSTLPLPQPQINFALAEQLGFTVPPIGTNDWIVVDFDARLFGVVSQTVVDLTVTPPGPLGGTSSWTPDPDFQSNWEHFRISAQAGSNIFTVQIAFDICAEQTRMDVDNVTVSSAGTTNPCQTPGDCNMTLAGGPDVCPGKQGTLPLLRLGAPDPFHGCPCTADFDDDGDVDINDFLMLLAAWTMTEGCYEEDLDCDHKVGVVDFMLVIARWGPCIVPPPGGGDPQEELEAAVTVLGFADLAAYEAWLLEASNTEALASGYALAALLLP